MSAEDFAFALNMMCRKYDNCSCSCPLYKFNYCMGGNTIDFDEVVRVVREWYEDERKNNVKL